MLTAIQELKAAARVLQRDKIVAKAAKPLEKKMQGIFGKQGKTFVAGFKKYRGSFAEAVTAPNLNPVFGQVWDETADDMKVAVKAGNTEGYKAGIAAASDTGLAISFTVGHPEAVKWLEDHAGEMVKGIDDTTRNVIGDIVTRGVEQGTSYSAIEREIAGKYQEFTDYRSHMIAVNEVGTAYGEGKRASIENTMVAQGLDMEKSWEDMGDDLVCPDCQANADDGWIPFDDQFSSGDDCEPHDPNCRCNVQYRVAPGPSDQEQAAASLGALETRR